MLLANCRTSARTGWLISRNHSASAVILGLSHIQPQQRRRIEIRPTVRRPNLMLVARDASHKSGFGETAHGPPRRRPARHSICQGNSTDAKDPFLLNFATMFLQGVWCFSSVVEYSLVRRPSSGT